MIRRVVRNWWVVALRGAAALLFGGIALAWPGVTLEALVLLFGVYSLADGAAAVAVGLRCRHALDRWWALLLEGLLGIGVGLLALLLPGAAALALLYLIAGWAAATGALRIAAAVRLRRLIRDEWLLGLSGAASLLFGLLLALAPAAGALALVRGIGLASLLLGALLLAFGFRLRGFARSPETPRRRVLA